MSAQFTYEMCITAENCKKNTKTPYFENSGSFKVIDVDTVQKLITSVCYDKLSMSASIRNCFHAKAVKKTLLQGVDVFDARLVGRFEPRGSGLKQLKFTLNAENCTCGLFWSISSHFVSIHG